mgnify:CR=1 FL=1
MVSAEAPGATLDDDLRRSIVTALRRDLSRMRLKLGDALQAAPATEAVVEPHALA